ncbi:A/G-specific adenine glycosylase [Labrys neptuniae]|uniref:A/G-specific adenine glycosylase n=1 Tax=Labrys neptuniae TaxID=376174 RepID=UPI0028912E75|nr:A/G-specific adenine glycosylase [Labrys neptuniae]MDT3380823.1 A/G-specific adenine glycosylase [Labrys neptuniae]
MLNSVAPEVKSPEGLHADALLAWYDRHRRRLPWRALPGEKPDPYRVWLSEIMLQQTTVKTVSPYFQVFLTRWPTVDAMAESDEEDILKAWAGLGYYSRARNLHACARFVSARLDGRFPDTVEGLRQLPGIGAYTAAAVAAIAFDRRAAVVDGNVERVVTRLEALETPLPQAKPRIAEIVGGMTPADRPGDFAQGMMDLGATICTPKRPACGLCPYLPFCRARREGTQETFPRKAPKARRPLRKGAAFWIVRPDGWVLVRKRPDKGLLGGMTEIPSSVWSEDFDSGTAVNYAPLKAKWRKLPGEVSHGFTHFELAVSVYAADALLSTKAPADCRWVRLDELDGEALPTVMRKIVALARGS